MLTDIQCERRLAHARPTSNDNEITFLETGRHLIQLTVSRWDTSDIARIVSAIQKIDPLHHLREQLMDVVEADASAHTRLGDLEYPGFGLVEELADVLAKRIQRAVGDLVAHRRELSHDRALVDDLGVPADIVRGRGVLRERAQIGEPARLVLVLARFDR